jgi:hypothetical protein
MRRHAMPLLLAAIALLFSPHVTAQTLGLPLSYRGVMRGFGGVIDVSGDKAGVRTFAGTVVVALGHIRVDSQQVPLFNLSGTIGKLFGERGQAGGDAFGGEVTVLESFGVGVDRSRWGGVNRLHVPVAAALPLMMCIDAHRLYELYLVPALSFERLDRPTGSSWQPSWGSVSLDFIWELRSGFGFQVGVGGLTQHQTSDPYRRVVMSAGIHLSPHGLLSSGADARAPDRQCSFGL